MRKGSRKINPKYGVSMSEDPVTYRRIQSKERRKAHPVRYLLTKANQYKGDLTVEEVRALLKYMEGDAR